VNAVAHACPSFVFVISSFRSYSRDFFCFLY
jgi:hypothetical protein